MTIVRIGSATDVAQPFASQGLGGANALGSIGDLDGNSPSIGLGPTAALRGVGGVGQTGAVSGTGEVSFGGILSKMVDQANSADRAAATKVEQLASGANDDLHGTMIATKEADISMKLLGSVRSKLIDAFHEIWRTSV